MTQETIVETIRLTQETILVIYTMAYWHISRPGADGLQSGGGWGWARLKNAGEAGRREATPPPPSVMGM